MSENRIMPAASGEAYWRDPATHPPPRGVKLLVLTSGGVACFGDWMDDSNFVAWSPMPKKTRPPAEPPAAEACVAFATALLRDWPEEMGVEGYDLIHIAVRAGLLVETTVRRPCGDQCRCACAYEPNEWPAGVTCYRVNPQFKRSA